MRSGGQSDETVLGGRAGQLGQPRGV